jgi:hypothetical protein
MFVLLFDSCLLAIATRMQAAFGSFFSAASSSRPGHSEGEAINNRRRRYWIASSPFGPRGFAHSVDDELSHRKVALPSAWKMAVGIVVPLGRVEARGKYIGVFGLIDMVVRKSVHHEHIERPLSVSKQAYISSHTTFGAL